MEFTINLSLSVNAENYEEANTIATVLADYLDRHPEVMSGVDVNEVQKL